MKIRIQGNSVRYRLTRSEVDRLAAGAILAEQTSFGTAVHQQFGYALETLADITDLKASFAERIITVFIPRQWALDWPGNNQVGFEARQEVAPGVILHLLVEKDFVCLDRPEEDQTDYFPHLGAC